MQTIQRWLSDLMNLFFLDPDNPQRLWPWWELGVLIGLLVFLMYVVTGKKQYILSL